MPNDDTYEHVKIFGDLDQAELTDALAHRGLDFHLTPDGLNISASALETVCADGFRVAGVGPRSWLLIGGPRRTEIEAAITEVARMRGGNPGSESHLISTIATRHGYPPVEVLGALHAMIFEGALAVDRRAGDLVAPGCNSGRRVATLHSVGLACDHEECETVVTVGIYAPSSEQAYAILSARLAEQGWVVTAGRDHCPAHCGGRQTAERV